MPARNSKVSYAVAALTTMPLHQLRTEWERRFGAFKDDPLYDESVKAGAEYRKAQVPDYMTEEPIPDVPA